MSANTASAAARLTAPRLSMPGRKAIVVGAGFAGLAAAMRLRACNFDVTVLEREAAPGGRARSLALAGVEIDPCATLLFTSDRALISLLEALGQPDELEAWPERAFQRADVDGVLHPLSTARPSARRPAAGVRWRDALRSVRLDRLSARYAKRLDRTAPERACVLDDRSAAEWARLYFGESVLSAWVAPWLTALTLGDENEASRLLFLLHYAAARNASPASLRSGPGALAEALARRVPTRLNVRVESVERAPGGGFELLACEAGRELRLATDAVVLAVPPAAALAAGAAVLTTAEKDHLASVRLRPALSAAFVTRNGVGHPARRIVTHGPGRALRTLQLQGGSMQPRVSGWLVAVASGAFALESAQASDDVVLRRLTAEAERLAGGALREIQAARVLRFGEGLPCFDVGHYRSLARLRRVEAAQLAAGRRLALAGDHLLGPRLEDAIASGLRAADALVGAG